jgi:hypothetical protein
MEIVIQKQETVQLDEIKIEFVRDLFEEKKIIARIHGLVRGVLLWSGDEEYEQAGNWTNETVLTRAQEVLSRPEVPWAF